MWFCAIEIKFNLFQWHRSNELFYYKNDFVHMSNINLRSLSLWWQRHFHKFETRKTFVCVTKKLNMQNACLYFYVAFINVSHSHLHKRFYHMCAIHIYYITASLLQDVTFVSIQRKRGLKVKHLNHFFFETIDLCMYPWMWNSKINTTNQVDSIENVGAQYLTEQKIVH